MMLPYRLNCQHDRNTDTSVNKGNRYRYRRTYERRRIIAVMKSEAFLPDCGGARSVERTPHTMSN